jgi:hypothetical protein
MSDAGDVAPQPGGGAAERAVPVRKSDMLDALTAGGGFADDAEREKFRRLCALIASIYHYEYFAALERLRNDYYYFNPEVAPHAALDHAALDRSYADLIATLDKVLKDANFVELPHAEIGAAHGGRTVLRVEIKAPLDDFRDVRFYRRGQHVEQFEVAEWLGLRRRKVEAEVYDDVVMIAAMKPQVEIASRRELKALERRKMRPGSVLLKCFRNVASADLNALFPNVRVVMSNADKLYLGVPAIAGGIPILINIYTTITVLFLVLGFYLGVSASVEDKDMKAALAALSGMVALGGFALRQWVKYQRRSLQYGTHRQHLLSQHQQQFRSLRLPDRRRRGAGMQGGVSRLPLPAYGVGAADGPRARPQCRRMAAFNLRRQCRLQRRRGGGAARTARPRYKPGRAALCLTARRGPRRAWPRMG